MIRVSLLRIWLSDWTRSSFGQVSLDVPVWKKLELDLDYRIEKALSNDAFYNYEGRRSFSAAFGVSF